MKGILLIVFIFLAVEIKSQVIFSPPGSEWSYNYLLSMGGAPGAPTYLEKIRYSRDSVLGNDTVKFLTHNRFYLECSSLPVTQTLIRQSGDTVYMRNYATNHTWQILYNFNSLPGQSWQTVIRIDASDTNPPKPLCSYTITVDSVSIISANGFNLKRLHVKYKCPSFGTSFPPYTIEYPATITERYGCDAFMFNYFNETSGWCDNDWFTRFLCYKDNQFGNRQFTSYGCDYQNPLAIDLNSEMGGILQIFPNPVHNTVKITFRKVEDYQIAIYNNLGEKICTFMCRDLENELELGELQNGLYFLVVYNNQGFMAVRKFIKE